MCLLTFYPATVMPDTTALFNGTFCNADGHGFAIVAGGRLIVERGMDAQAMIEAFETARHRYPDGPALFHSRYATHGHTGLDNCHPFAVGGDARTVLAHNGVLPTVVRPVKGDPRSDTRIAAEEFLPAFGSLRTRRNRRRFERWMTPDNKMVVLTVDRRFTQRAYLFNEASGIWDGGILLRDPGRRRVGEPGQQRRGLQLRPASQLPAEGVLNRLYADYLHDVHRAHGATACDRHVHADLVRLQLLVRWLPAPAHCDEQRNHAADRVDRGIHAGRYLRDHHEFVECHRVAERSAGKRGQRELRRLGRRGQIDNIRCRGHRL